MRNTEEHRVILEIKTARTGEETPEAMVQFLSSLLKLKKKIHLFFTAGVSITLEVAAIDQRLHFYISVPASHQSFIESHLAAQYPKVLISTVRDYLPDMFTSGETLSVAELKLLHNFIYPIRIYSDFKDVDPMSSFLSVLSKAQTGDRAVVQFVLIPTSNSWQRVGRRFIDVKKTDASGINKEEAKKAPPFSRLSNCSYPEQPGRT